MPRTHTIDDFNNDVTSQDVAGTPTPDDDGMPITGSIEIPGMKIADVDDFITDPFTGKRWAVPTGALDDNLIHTSPYLIRNKDPNYHYQAVRLEELGDMESQGFVKVTRKETGVDTAVLDGDTPAPLSSYHTIGEDQILIKMPKVLADRRYAAQKALCDSAVQVAQVRPNIEPGTGREFTKDSRKAFDKDGSRIA